MQTACARAGEVLAGAPLDNGNVDPRQRQLARQHQPCRTSAGDHHRVLGHSRTPVVITPVPPAHQIPPRRVPATAPRVPPSVSASPRDPYVDNNTSISLLPFPVGSGL